jgi:hypothetical protein
MCVDVFHQLQLGLRRADDHYFFCPQQRLGDAVEIIFVHRRLTVAQGACGGVHFVVRAVRLNHKLLYVVGAEVDDMGLGVVNPNDGMVVGHRV